MGISPSQIGGDEAGKGIEGKPESYGTARGKP
jgi:hypothetical protein